MRSAFVHIQKGTAQQKSLAKNVTLVSDLPTTGKLEECEFSRQKSVSSVAKYQMLIYISEDFNDDFWRENLNIF